MNVNSNSKGYIIPVEYVLIVCAYNGPFYRDIAGYNTQPLGFDLGSTSTAQPLLTIDGLDPDIFWQYKWLVKPFGNANDYPC
tara:strand:+ start:217 stop:462 length:246 start_codon:yes stop_codon:yes gene_type:complete